MTAPALGIDELVVRRGNATVLEVERLDVAPGATVVLMGANGAGKTTMLYALAGLVPAAGTVSYDARPATPEERRRRSALVMQTPALVRGSVASNAALGLRLRGVGRREAQARARTSLDLLGLAPLASRDARALSAGEAQRLAIARALAITPAVLLLDEPTAHLDALGRADLHDHLTHALAAHRPTTVIATHDARFATSLASWLVVLADGRVIQEGAPDSVRGTPSSRHVATLLEPG